jgi:hypothetical protein
VGGGIVIRARLWLAKLLLGRRYELLEPGFPKKAVGSIRWPPGEEPEVVFVSWGCLNLRWNEDGSLECIHNDQNPCKLHPHTTISTYVRNSDLKRPTPAHIGSPSDTPENTPHRQAWIGG